jgi:hypothetical protein
MFMLQRHSTVLKKHLRSSNIRQSCTNTSLELDEVKFTRDAEKLLNINQKSDWYKIEKKVYSIIL